MFQQSLAHNLDRLGELLYVDVDIGLSQLREGLPRMLRKSRPFDTSSDCAQFFETYELPGGKRLSTDSVRKLVGIASTFPSGTEAERNEQDFERKYGDDPESFWSLLSPPQDPSAISIIRHISESFNEQNYLSPVRRRIILSVLFERVHSESQQIQANGNTLKRGQTFKAVANDTLLDCLWDTTDPSTKRKRDQFLRNVRAGGKWTRFEPGVLVGLADQQAWTTWEKSMNNKELKAIAEYMSSLPAYERWKRLSPLVSRLKSVFLSRLTRAAGDAAQSGSGKRKRGGEDGHLQDQNALRQERRANTYSSSGHENTRNTALPRGHSQPPTPVSDSHLASNMAASLQVLAEAATASGRLNSALEYSPPLIDQSLINEINDFDISGGHTTFFDVTNDFDISAGPRAALQPPPLGETSFVHGMSDFDNQTGPRLVPRPPSSVPFIDVMNDFDISACVGAGQHPSLSNIIANTSSNFEIPHENLIDSSSFQRMNDFDISAGQENVSSPISNVDTSQFQHLIGA
ncbi:MAG: hypothetical protein Q9217_006375 [Psora testacea]